MNTYEQIMNAKGFYCNFCDCYHPENEMIFTYTLKTVGRPVGLIHPEFMYEAIACPDCEEGDELEDFNPLWWSHLCAYLECNPIPLRFKYPIFESDYLSEVIGYGHTESPDTLQKIADDLRLCIEVLSIAYNEQEGVTVVEVDLL